MTTRVFSLWCYRSTVYSKKLCLKTTHPGSTSDSLDFSLSAVYKVVKALSDWSRYYVAVSKSLIFEKGLTLRGLRACVRLEREREREWKEKDVDDGGGGSSDEQRIERRTPPKWSRNRQISRQIDAGTKTRVFWKLFHNVRLKGAAPCVNFFKWSQVHQLVEHNFQNRTLFLICLKLNDKISIINNREWWGWGKWIIMIFMLNGISLLLFETTLSMMKYPHPVFWKIETINSV